MTPGAYCSVFSKIPTPLGIKKERPEPAGDPVNHGHSSDLLLLSRRLFGEDGENEVVGLKIE